MDTPERSKIGGTLIAKFEDSPIFNFIDNLSPIQPAKSTSGAQVFHSPSFASISSIFSSPHLNLQKESRLLKRHLYSDSSKQDISSDNLEESNLYEELSDTIHPIVTRETCKIICSLNEATIDPPEDCSSQLANLPQPIQYDCGSPNHNTTPCYDIKIELKLDNGQTPVEGSDVFHEGIEKRKHLFSTEIELEEEHQILQNNEEVDVCDWESLITEDAENLLIFDSSTDSDACKVHEEKFENNDSNLLTCSSLKSVDVDCCLQNATQHLPQGNHVEFIVEHGTDHTPQILSGKFQNQILSNVQSQEEGKGTCACISTDCKVESQQQRGIRRRCLTFELAGGSKNSNFHHTISLPSSRKFTPSDKRSISLKPGNSSSTCVLPSLGLHLNALATTANDRMITKETHAFGKRLITRPCSMSPFPPIAAKHKSLNKSLDVKKDQCPTDEVQELDVTHDDAFEASEFGVGENFSWNGPKKKRRKLENGSESEGCKRCNCKKSKCLKLELAGKRRKRKGALSIWEFLMAALLPTSR